MKCPECGTELSAVGGVPTVWQCNPCTQEKVTKRVSRPEVRYIGDTLQEFRRL